RLHRRADGGAGLIDPSARRESGGGGLGNPPATVIEMTGFARAFRGRVGFAWAIAGCCMALAGLSLLLPWGLSFDPWGWVLYGREIVDPIKFDTASYPSWKPLP